MKTLLSITCILLACQAVRAGDAKPAAPVVQMNPVVSGTANATANNAYAVRKKSLFTASADAHNPFWPIGWVKMEEASSSDSAAPVIPHSDDFNVTSILLNEPPLAVINGQEMAEGEIASLPVNGQNVMVQLMAVQDGRVILRWQNQNITVPLHRDEQLSTGTTAQNN
jgi:hypothetical protein